MEFSELTLGKKNENKNIFERAEKIKKKESLEIQILEKRKNRFEKNFLKKRYSSNSKIFEKKIEKKFSEEKKNYFVKKKKFLSVLINFDNKKKKLEICLNENLFEFSKKFCLENNLDNNKCLKLFNILKENKMKYFDN